MKFKLTIFTILLFAILTIGYIYRDSFNSSTTDQNNSTDSSLDKQTLNNLIIQPQSPVGTVTVESVNLYKNSYLVVREVVESKLGQIVEISKPLKAGLHKNVTIQLGNADISGKELIVMVYDDQNSDGIFNDFDQPTIDGNGKMIARYIKTGKPIPSNLAEGDLSGQHAMHNMTGMASMERIRYTVKGFVPEELEVPVGSMVEFINESNTVMWVASSPHPAHTDLPTFDQFKPSQKGTVYRYVFDKKGVWKFHDHINAAYGGVITVK